MTIKEKKQSWYQANKERIKAKSKAYYSTHRQEKQAWYQANKDRIRARYKKRLRKQKQSFFQKYGTSYKDYVAKCKRCGITADSLS